MLNKLKNKSGFSMAEMLIAIAALGVLAAIVTPSLNRFSPDKQTALFKKEYLQVERIVYELINDNDLYPEKLGKVGFQNRDAVTIEGTTYGDSADENSDEASSKFAKLLKSKLNTVSDENDKPFFFKTTDGVGWYIVPGADRQEIFIDIDGFGNGADKTACLMSEGMIGCFLPQLSLNSEEFASPVTTKNINSTNECESGIDVYRIWVQNDGKINYTPDSCEELALKKHKIVK